MSEHPEPQPTRGEPESLKLEKVIHENSAKIYLKNVIGPNFNKNAFAWKQNAEMCFGTKHKGLKKRNLFKPDVANLQGTKIPELQTHWRKCIFIIGNK